MRILLAIHHFPPAYHGGAEWRALRTANELQRQGHTVRVVCIEALDRPDVDELAVQSDEFEGVAVDRLLLGLPRGAVSHQRNFNSAPIARHIGRMIAAFRPDVLHLIGGYLITAGAIAAARAADVPVIVTLTDFWFLCPRITLVRSDERLCTVPEDPLGCVRCLLNEKRRYRLVDRASGGLSGGALTRWWHLAGAPRRGDAGRWSEYIVARRRELPALLHQASAVISPSRYLRDLYVRSSLNPEPFVFMRQGLETARWLPAAPRVDDGATFHVGYIGQLSAHKGVEVLIDAFARLQPSSRRPVLHIYGPHDRDPRYVAHLKRRAAGQADVRFEGVFPNREMLRVHAGLDVLVVPSLWYENSPTVILEAYAAGTPVIVSALGGMAELVQDGISGYWFPPGDVAALARQLQRLMDDRQTLLDLRAGLPAIKTVEQEVHELVDIYVRAAHGADGAGSARPTCLALPCVWAGGGAE